MYTNESNWIFEKLLDNVQLFDYSKLQMKSFPLFEALFKTAVGRLYSESRVIT